MGQMEKRRREMRAVTPEPGRGRECVGFAERGGFELQPTPGLHLPRASTAVRVSAAFTDERTVRGSVDARNGAGRPPPVPPRS